MRKIVKDMAKVLKTLGHVPYTANSGHKVRFTSEEIKFISRVTKIPGHEIYMKFG